MPLSPPDTQTCYTFLAQTDALGPADLIIGFGHFDLRIPRYAAQLYQQGFAPRILFTGGVGSGSADFTAPEAVVFADEARRLGLPDEALFVESRSTNTAENCTFSLDLLAAEEPPFRFERVLLIATPYRMRRVASTVARWMPWAQAVCAPVPSSLEEDTARFAEKGEDLPALLAGELQRLVTYGERGWLVAEPLPPPMAALYASLSP